MKWIFGVLVWAVISQAAIWDEASLNYRIDRFHHGEFASFIDSKNHSFIVFLPKNYSEQVPYKIIYFLAGGAGAAEQMPQQLENYSDLLEHPFYQNTIWVVLNMNSHGMWSDNLKEKSSSLLLEFIAYFESHVKHQAGRTLIGHSLGGSGAFHFALEYSQYFDRIASISPAILKWNVFDSTPELIQEFIKEHAPEIPFEFFKFVTDEMKKDFGTREVWDEFDFYHRIQNKVIPKCFAIFMGGQDPMGFKYLGDEFISFAAARGKSIPYIESPTRYHSIGIAITEVADYFQSCSQ
jgi:pimeloyl-ACP methyl ester carboxylesterase